MRSRIGSLGTSYRKSHGRLPIIVFGDSNAAQGYVHASNYPSQLQVCQPAQEWAHNMYCHQGESQPVTWITSNEIKPLGPFSGAAGILRGSFVLDLGEALSAIGVPATILDYAVGSSTFDNYSPTINPSAYATRLNWVKARLAQMPGHLDPILLTDQGMAGQGQNQWDIDMTTLMAALRADLGYPHLKVIQILPPTTGFSTTPGWNFIMQVERQYAATDPDCQLAWNNTTTFINDSTLVEGQPTGVHFDVASSRKLVYGPDDADTLSVMTGIRSILGV